MKLPPQITWLQYALANAAIVILIPFLALQGMPPIDWAWSWAAPAKETEQTPVANWLATTVSPIADVTGVATAEWKMFAPEPDVTNHRLRATIEYRDGTIIQWRSPEWPQLSCWQRFWTSRELEYIDKISYNSPSDRRFAFADYLAARHRKNPQPESAPRRVTFVKEEAYIANPNIDGWIPMSQPIPRSDEEVFTPKRIYPVPLELLKKQKDNVGRKNHPMIAVWNRFFHEPVDPRIPALIRIGYASVVLVNLLAWFPYLEMWFGETGVLPSNVQYLGGYQWSLLALVPPSHAALQICFWLFALQTLCLLFGFASRFSAVSVFVWLVSFQNRNQMILDGEDDILRLLGFFLIFMPLAEVWSVDAGRRNQNLGLPYRSTSSPWALRMLQYVMVMMMFATGLWKFAGEPWRDGTALYYVARIDDLFGRFPVPHYLFDTPWTVRAMTWSVLYVELAIPFLIWIPKARRFSLLVLLAFHLSNEWAMHLFLFHWIMLCGWMSFLKKEDLDAAARLWQRITGARSADVPQALPAAK